MSLTAAPDARRAMRDALHRLVHEADDWSRPSLTIFRNRLLDEVSSDARPLANLLVEAIDRGVIEAFPRTPLAPPAWSARSTPFVMRWVADRFLQPEVARWAVEAWGYALGCIDTSQLTASVDAPEPTPMSPSWPLATLPTAAGGPGRTTAALPAATRGLASPPSTGSTAPWRGPAGPSRGAGLSPATVAARAYRPPVPSSAASNWAVANASRVAIGTAAIAVLSYVYIFASAAMRATPTLATQQATGPAVTVAAAMDDGALPFGARAVTGGVSGAAPAEIPTTYGDPGGTVAARAGASSTDDGGRSAQASGAAAAAAAASGIGVGGRATRVPLTAGSGNAASLAMTRLPAEGATPMAFLELAARSSARRVAEGTAEGDAPTTGSTPATPAPVTPGVPGITRNALPLRGDVASAQRVRPATRPARERPLLASPFAGGLPNTMPTSEPTRALPVESRPATASAATANPAPATGAPSGATGAARATVPVPRAPVVAPAADASTAPANAAASRVAPTPGLDQLRLRSGRRITGRVEVIRASSVVFRDAETGLRYEFAKDDIDEVITEFGSAVRFRSAASVARGTDRRTASVAGRYAVTYEAARVNGSPACRDLWRGPSGQDAAIVRHRAGDDTLSVAFEGGDQFPSVLDADGFFSSTFRIMPGQEQLATALTTRLTGRFGEDGSLALQVNVIGYRRVQGTRGVACHIIVDATGRRAP